MNPSAPKPGLVRIYDTTLRDGTQREGLSLSAVDKLRIARLLDGMGVAFIELGWPGSNPKDAEAFERARDVQWAHAALTAFGSTRRARLRARGRPAGGRAPRDGRAGLRHLRQVVRAPRARRAPHLRGGEPADDRRDGRLPGRERAPRRVRRRALLRRLAREPRLRDGDAPRRGRRGRRDGRPVRHERRLAPLADRGARRGGGRGHRRAHRHPRARRHGLRRRELDRGGARRRRARAGHAERLRRAVRQREPLLDRAEPRAQDGPHVPAPWRAGRADARRVAGRGDREPRARPARGVRRPQRLRAQGRRARRGHPPERALVRARRPGARGQQDARRRERALGARQPARQGGGVRGHAGGRRDDGRAARPEGARGPRLRVRGRRGVGGAHDEARVGGVRAAVRAGGLQGHRRPAGARRGVLGGHHQAARARRDRAHGRRGQRPGRRARRGAPQGAHGGVPAHPGHQARGLQGPHPRQRGRHVGHHARHDRHDASARSAGRRWARAPTCSRRLGWPSPTGSSTGSAWRVPRGRRRAFRKKRQAKLRKLWMLTKKVQRR